MKKFTQQTALKVATKTTKKATSARYLAPLNYDVFFRKIFSDITIAKAFLEDFLDKKIDEITTLPLKHKLTTTATNVEFAFRCKIEGKYIIIDMQQWYKPDIVKRFYVYHAASTVLQLEKLDDKAVEDVMPSLTTGAKSTKARAITKRYSDLEPVVTLVWLVNDSLGFQDDFVSFILVPERSVDFIQNATIWHNKNIQTLVAHRKEALLNLQNKTKSLDFLPQNKLVFMLQKNIIKNKNMAKYERWFEFARLTLPDTNTANDFIPYKQDKIFSKIIKRLETGHLPEDEINYIITEAEYQGNLDNWEEDVRREGIEQGVEQGARDNAFKIAKKLKLRGLGTGDIADVTGLAIAEIVKL